MFGSKTDGFRLRLLVAFGLVLVCTFGLVLLSHAFFYQRQQLSQSRLEIEKTAARATGVFLAFQLSLSEDVPQEQLFSENRTAYFEKYQRENKEVHTRIEKLIGSTSAGQLGMMSPLVRIKLALSQFNALASRISSIQKIKGFKDLGYIGLMRASAHTLEQDALIPSEALLMLRRHEKDFFLRRDTSYVVAFSLLKSEIDARLAASNAKNAEMARTLLNHYANDFFSAAELEKSLGLYPGQGLLGEIAALQADVQHQISQIEVLAEIRERKLARQLAWGLAVMGMFLLGFTLFVAVTVSDDLTQPVVRVLEAIKAFTQDRFQEPVALETDERDPSEARELIAAFSALQVEVVQYSGEMVRQKDASEAANKEKSRFLAHMSHEIRTPMNGVIGLANLLKESVFDPQQRELLDAILLSTTNLQGVINDVLDFSRIEQGSIEMASAPIALKEELTKVGRMASLKAKMRGLSFRLDLDPNVPDMIIGDQTRLFQVIHNLLNNALKFTHEGGIVLKVEPPSGEPEQGQRRIRFSVKDTGIGISTNQQDRLFQPFSQAEAATSRKYGGAGLGLVICRDLARLMGGEIGLNSALGVGSEFWFEAPFEVPAQQTVKTLATAPLLQAAQAGPLNVLIVEDNPINQKVVANMLQRMGHQYVIAENGLQGLDLIREHVFDLVLMDIQMPVMDGIEATRHIRASVLPSVAKVPIIAVTANATVEDRNACFQAGMNAFLTKPLMPEQLRQAISEHLI